MTTPCKPAACDVCGARPWPPAGSGVRGTFSLRYFSPNGVPTAASEPGAWRCEQHYPPRTQPARPAATSPTAALIEFERLLASELARLEEAVDDDASATIKTIRAAVKRGVGEFKKILAASEPPPPDPKPSRRKSSPTIYRADQIDLIADGVARDAAEASP